VEYRATFGGITLHRPRAASNDLKDIALRGLEEEL
jgi:hypothetical protein